MTTTASQLVTFRVGEELFAADIRSVERVLAYVAPRPVPGVPQWVEGVIEYQERVVPVIDLRRRFGMPAPTADSGMRMLILAAGDEWVGAIVDAVLEVSPMETESISEPPPIFRGLRSEYLNGILRREDGLVLVLNVDRLLDSHEQLALAEVSVELNNG
jgi:purine-binding chemotaxis protein CheW